MPTDNNLSNQSPSDESKSGESENTLSRRRFTKAAVAAPAVLTLFSRPVFANSNNPLCTISGFASGPLMSGNFDEAECAIGKGPDTWQSISNSAVLDPLTNTVSGATEWPRTGAGGVYIGPDQLFDTVFFSGDYANKTRFPPEVGLDHPLTYVGEKVTLLGVLQKGGGTGRAIDQLARHSIAALLNVSSRSGFGFTYDQVIDIFNNALSGGVHTLSSGMSLETNRLIDFYATTYATP